MKIISVYFKGETNISVPGGDGTSKFAISTRSTYDFTWELDYDPSIRMLKVYCTGNSPGSGTAQTWVPVEHVTSMLPADKEPAKK